MFFFIFIEKIKKYKLKIEFHAAKESQRTKS